MRDEGSPAIGLAAPVSDMGAVVHRLSQSPTLSRLELGFLQTKMEKHKVRDAKAVLAEDGLSTTKTTWFLLSGWACRQRIMADGRRQIFSFLIPGDVISTPTRLHMSSPISIVALTQVMTADVLFEEEAQFNSESMSVYSKLIDAASRETQDLLHDQIVRLGCMTGSARMGDLLLELQRRLFRVGLANERSFPMPLTQEMLADALGMSAVHANRSMQQLRLRNLINYSRHEVTVRDPDGLTALIEGGESWV